MNFIKSGLIRLMHVSTEDLAEIYGVDESTEMDIEGAIDRISSITSNPVLGRFVKPEHKQMLSLLSENKEVIVDTFKLAKDGMKLLGMSVTQ